MRKFVNELAKFVTRLTAGMVVGIIAVIMVVICLIVVPVRAESSEEPDDELEITETTFIWRASGCNGEDARNLAYDYNADAWDGYLIYSSDGKHIASVNQETGRIWIDNQDTAYSVDYKYAAGEFLLRTADGSYLRDSRSGQITLYKGGIEVAKVESIEQPEPKTAEPLKLGDEKLFHILQDAYYDKTWNGQNIEVSSLPCGWSRTNEYRGIFAKIAYNDVVFVNNAPAFHLGSNRAWKITYTTDGYDIRHEYIQTYAKTIFTLDGREIRGESLNHYVSAGAIDCVHLRVQVPDGGKPALVRAYSNYLVVFTLEELVDGKKVYKVYQTVPGDEIKLIAENVVTVEPEWNGIALTYVNGSSHFLQLID